MVASVPADLDPHRIIALSTLSEEEIERIMDLKQLCEDRSGISILLTRNNLRSLYMPGTGAHMLVKDDRISGLVFFYSFIPEEAEAVFFVHPDEDWRAASLELLNTTKAVCERRGYLRLLIMNDQRYSAGAELLIKMGCKLAFSEHRMELMSDPVVPGQPVDLREVDDDDPTLRHIEYACHGRFHSKPDQRRFVASFDGRPMGKIDVCMDGMKAELTGFCVIPSSRRRGFGRSILMEIVKILRLEGKAKIVLDVQTDNDNALSLYQRSGFRKGFTMNYYELALNRIS